MSTRDSFKTCEECIHYRELCGRNCPAFPNRIPDEIFHNAYSHDKILPNQKGAKIFEFVESRLNFYIKTHIKDCRICVNFKYSFINKKDHYYCDAFPDKIPRNIAEDASIHDKILPNQKGDLIFEKRELFKLIDKLREESKQI